MKISGFRGPYLVKINSSSPLGPNGVAAVGEGVLVVSSPTLVRVYKLASPISGRIAPIPLCNPGQSLFLTCMDSVFDQNPSSPTFGQFLDARIMGLSLDSVGSVVDSAGLTYDPAANTWNCFGGVPSPTPGCEYNAFPTGVSCVGKDDFWYGARPAGSWFCVGFLGLVWHYSSGAWSAPMNPPNPFHWLAPGFNSLTMVRGVPGPITGWASFMDTTTNRPSVSWFDGFNWQDSVPAIEPCSMGSCNEGFQKMSIPYGDPNHGWAVTGEYLLAYLDTTMPSPLPPAPGTWIAPAGQGSGYPVYWGVYMKSSSDVWACGNTPSNVPVIAHTTAPYPTIPIPITIPAAPGNSGNPWLYPALMDIAFNSVAPNKGIAVGGPMSPGTPAGTPPLVYVTTDGGNTWTFVPITVPPTLTDPVLYHVRFVSPTKAYAIGYGHMLVEVNL